LGKEGAGANVNVSCVGSRIDEFFGARPAPNVPQLVPVPTTQLYEFFPCELCEFLAHPALRQVVKRRELVNAKTKWPILDIRKPQDLFPQIKYGIHVRFSVAMLLGSCGRMSILSFSKEVVEVNRGRSTEPLPGVVNSQYES